MKKTGHEVPFARRRALRAAACVCAALAAAGCDRGAGGSWNAEERSDGLYQAAMADYKAGRIDAAIDGFDRVVRDNPANASARFQLATLLQDSRHDHLSAICHYREYLLQRPDSDKSGLAKERLAMCERQYAAALVEKLKTGQGELAEELASLKESLKKASDESKALKAELAKARDEAAAAKRESERTKRLVASLGDEESSAKPSLASAKALLDEEEDEGMDRAKFAADVKELVDEEASEKTASPFAPAPRRQQPQAAKAEEPPHEKRPATYLVQEGDTLYKIAIRFYGKRSAWTRIRDANKTAISVDGRVNAGERIVLPE